MCINICIEWIKEEKENIILVRDRTINIRLQIFHNNIKHK